MTVYKTACIKIVSSLYRFSLFRVTHLRSDSNRLEAFDAIWRKRSNSGVSERGVRWLQKHLFLPSRRMERLTRPSRTKSVPGCSSRNRWAPRLSSSLLRSLAALACTFRMPWLRRRTCARLSVLTPPGKWLLSLRASESTFRLIGNSVFGNATGASR
jgi:hypothetical protein